MMKVCVRFTDFLDGRLFRVASTHLNPKRPLLFNQSSFRPLQRNVRQSVCHYTTPIKLYKLRSHSAQSFETEQAICLFQEDILKNHTYLYLHNFLCPIFFLTI